MNAKDAIDLLDQCGSCDILHGNEELVIRALRLLAAAEANDGSTPECRAEQELYANSNGEHAAWELAERFERERTGLAARVRELEAQVRIAAGMLSTCPGFSDKHPQVALDAIEIAARSK